ncbi:hypothetical protein LbFV_ORF85 [Leptopilina boulardi filamentous virus]|uniref:Uncharacterized protein n=1 Tax=Leptopilina boulardi filamentous virus TaxID=552509 RepID=A0A1S5YDE0_9VIRU|nr:hypothetical protein LbFV_ORF85 [Leptopilina boulardi filamentous virus]AQQ80005.1 hypothetical protein LbFV_ORF85 [Leptopilina boulardi filamentous virus]
MAVEKYSNEAISLNLKEWEPFKDANISENSIESYLYEKSFPPILKVSKETDETNVKLNLISVCYTRTSCYPLLYHWFLNINNVIIWHPGNSSNDIFSNIIPKEGLYIVSSQYEFCDKCTYWFLLDKFMKDKLFNIVYFNCEIIVGNCIQTIFIALTLTTLLLYICFHILIFLILSLLFLIFHLASDYFPNNSIQHYRCRHVKNFINNIHVYNIKH